MAIAAEAEADLRELLAIPANYKVLFLQGGASLAVRDGADEPAARQDQRRLRQHRRVVEEGDQGSEDVTATVNVAASQRGQELHLRADAGRRGSSIPTRPTCTTRRTKPSAASSSTGCRRPATCRWWPTCPRTSCRARSMCRKFGLIYAGAQKNIGPAGLTIVIVRDDLIGQALPARRRCSTTRSTPTTTRCTTRRRPTPCTSPGLVFQWLKQQGGLADDGEDQHRQGRACCTTTSTRPSFYALAGGTRRPLAMNVPFTLKDAALDEAFLKGAKARGLVAAEGPPLGRRHARLDLQRHADRRRAGAGRLHARIREKPWLSAAARFSRSTRSRARARAPAGERYIVGGDDRRSGCASWCVRPTCTRWTSRRRVQAIGRAGAGTNNIPVKKMSERGVPVFNAPGANANAVKELVIAGMLMAARNLVPALQFVDGLIRRRRGDAQGGRRRQEALCRHRAAGAHAGRDRPGQDRLPGRRCRDQARHERARLRSGDHRGCRLEPAVAGEERRQRRGSAEARPTSSRCTCRCSTPRAT